MDSEHINQMAGHILKEANSDSVATEVLMNFTNKFSLSSFEGEISKYQISDSFVLGVRVEKDNKIGTAFTEYFDKDSFLSTYREAVAISVVMEDDQHQKIVAEPDSSLASATENNLRLDTSISTQEKIDLSLSLEKNVLECEGIEKSPHNGYGENHSKVCLYNTNGVGLIRNFDTYSAYTSALVDKQDKQGIFVHGTYSDHYAGLDPAVSVREACQHAKLLWGGEQIKTGKYDVIFDIDTFSSFAGIFLGKISSGYDAMNGLNPFQDKLGSAVFDARITIKDAPSAAFALYKTYFDDEGFKAAEVSLAKAGVWEHLLHNSQTRSYYGLDKTPGSAARGPKSKLGVSVSNLDFSAGSDSMEDVVAEEYLEVISMQGLTSGVNPLTGDFSFAVSGYLKKSSDIISVVKGVTLSGNFYEILQSHIVHISRETFISADRDFRAPLMRLSELSVGGSS